MKTLIKLFIADLKLTIRNRQSLFWMLMFPLMFTFIFGFFFGKGSVSAGTIALINQSNTPIAQSMEKAMDDSTLFKVQKETDVNHARDLLKNNKVAEIVILPENFGDPKSSSNNVKLIYDPGNATSNAVIQAFLGEFINQTNYQVQGVKPLFGVDQEKTTTRNLGYFDFVLVGILGMALMNSSVQGLAINMSKYREDKILKRITTTPLPSWIFVTAEVLSRLVVNIIQITIILLIGIYFFKANLYGNIFLIYLLALAGAILFQLLGFAIAGFAKTTDAAEGMATAIAIPMMFLAGVFFPIDQLPKWLFSIVQYLPLAPFLRLLRGYALNTTSPLTTPVDIVIVLAWIVVLLGLSIYKFRLSEE